MVMIPGEPVPSLDWYNGRKVEAVEEEGDWWTLVLSGNIRITNHDQRRPMPEKITGKPLLTIIQSEGETKLVFGELVSSVDAGEFQLTNTQITNKREVGLTPTQYSISDPGYGNGEPIFPQRPIEWQDQYPVGVERPSEGTEEAGGGTEPHGPEEG